MRLPLKLNVRGWPVTAPKVLPVCADPRDLLDDSADGTKFSNAVSTLKFGPTFKTTSSGRFPRTVEKLAQLRFETPPVVLDVGASDGSTSLDVIGAVAFRRYYCTDLNHECRVMRDGAWTYFYSADGEPLLAASSCWVVYGDTESALPFFGAAARRVLARAPQLEADAQRIALVNPALRQLRDSRVTVQRYSVLDTWTGEPADLVLAANLLNRGYFSDESLVRIVGNLRKALSPTNGGWLVLVDNRDIERSSLIEIRGRNVELRERVDAGVEVEDLVLRALRNPYA